MTTDINEADILIQLYFTLEDPLEQDVVFDKLVALRNPTVDHFLKSMLVHDADDFLRARAAGELARRGFTEGFERLLADLNHPPELCFFEHAVRTLCDLHYLQIALFASFDLYDTLKKIWQNASRSSAERKEAMLGMEQINTKQALVDFVALIDSIVDMHNFPYQHLETAMLAFVQHHFIQAQTCLERLKQRIMQAWWHDAHAQQEAADMVQEGIALLKP